MNCGCGKPDDKQGRPENLTADDLRAAARVNAQSLPKTAQNILAAVERLERRGSDTPAGRVQPGKGLAQPAGAMGAKHGARGTPESES